MIVLLVGSAFLIPFLREGGQAIRPLYLGLTAVLALGAVIFAGIFESKTADGFLFWLIPLVYVISVAFLLLFDRPFTFPFWTFAGMFLLCAFRLRFGMFLNIFLMFVIGSMQTELLSEVLIMQVLCLVLFGFVMPYAKVFKDGVNVLISVAAILVSVRVVCYLTMDKASLTNDIFCVAVVYAIVICAVLLLSKALEETLLLQEQTENFEFLEELAAGAEEQDANVSEYISMTEGDEDAVAEVVPSPVTESMETAFDYTLQPDERVMAQLKELSEESAPLLVEFAARFPKAFLHVRRVALFAEEVAEKMGNVNATLVKCGGYYHEIGRLRGEKTLENTLLTAEEASFPQALVSVLREHTVDGDKPTTKEAALLLLTDNVCGMCEHLKKTQKGKILIVKVIDRAINLRLTKGDFSSSGLSAGDLTNIRNAMAEVIKEDMF